MGRYSEHVRGMRSAFKTVVGKPERKKPFGTYKRIFYSINPATGHGGPRGSG